VQAVCDYDYQQIIIKAIDENTGQEESRFNYSMHVDVQENTKT